MPFLPSDTAFSPFLHWIALLHLKTMYVSSKIASDTQSSFYSGDL